MEIKLENIINKKYKKLYIAGAAGLLLLIFIIAFGTHYSVEEIVVVGNTQIDSEEIIADVRSGPFGGNTLLLSAFKKEYQPDDIPLIENIQVQKTGAHSLRVTVQEIQLIGYVQFLDCNMYFDVEGTVVDSAVREEKGAEQEEDDVLAADEVIGKSADSFAAALTDIPRIQGLSFSSVRLGEALPVEDDSVFNTILGISRMLNKYTISPEYVEFDQENNVSVHIGDIVVELGQDQQMEEKLARMASILPLLSGKSGVLHLEEYDGSSLNVIFSDDSLPDGQEEPDSEDGSLPDGQEEPAGEDGSQPEETQTEEPAGGDGTFQDENGNSV